MQLKSEKGTQIMEISFALTKRSQNNGKLGRTKKKNLSISHLCRIYCLFHVELLIVSLLFRFYLYFHPAAVWHFAKKIQRLAEWASSINDQKRDTVPNMTRRSITKCSTRKRFLCENYRNLLHNFQVHCSPLGFCLYNSSRDEMTQAFFVVFQATINLHSSWRLRCSIKRPPHVACWLKCFQINTEKLSCRRR